MADDEAHTIKTLNSYSKIISDYIHQYSGNMVDSPDVNLLVVFRSVADAIQYAFDLQKRLKKENDRLAKV